LADLLDSLAKQNFHEPFEIIVVDNDAGGGAAATVDSAKMRHAELDIKYSVELQKGISFARNTAVSLAVGEFLAWIDDDETATENWLELLWKTRSLSGADAVFGPVVPIFPPASPSWPIRSRIFERPRHATGTVIDAREARTGNALVKASLFSGCVPPFDIKLANTGGEDYDLFARLQATGARYEWCDEAVVYELVPPERQQVKWVLERRLRGSVHYWRRHSSSNLQKGIRASVGGCIFIVCCLAGIVAAPFSFPGAVRLWWRAMGGLGRVVALSGIQWRGY
jgi:glycosyltransferase involved in cell wall biosynthesis